ncbi:MAG: hypothetical protein P1V19_00420 [Gimesia sp.]|nr:hypothetical protein [Gimesia sp.]
MIKARSFLFLAACGTAAVVSTVLFVTTSYAQQSSAQRTAAAARQFEMAKNLYEDLKNPFNVLLRQLKNAKTVEQKAQTKKAIQAALVEYFNADMKQRRAELEKLTSRSSGMSAALEKRAAAKEQLVELQLKSFKYEVEGLGLFTKQRAESQWTGRKKLGYFGAPLLPSAPHIGQNGLVTVTWSLNTGPLKTAMSHVSEGQKKLQSAKSEEDQKKATTELRKALSEYFDVDMKARQQEIDTINAGLKKMEGGLKKRSDAKDDIVDLQLQIIVNEAEGLGFFREAPLNSDDVLRGTGLSSGMGRAGAANPPGIGGPGLRPILKR